jgi:LmbE family N-acetylglucosaminyl deacetylase
MTDHLIISPHCDDALLGMGGRMQLLAGNKKVVTVFGTCAWTARPKEYKLHQLTAVNQAEERAAIKATDSELVLMDYPEALLRNYRKWDALRLHSSDKALAAEIGAALKEHIAEADHIYLPIAPGSHVDHRLISGMIPAFYELFGRQSKQFYVYEDLPYSWYGGLNERLELLSEKFTMVPNVVDISTVIDQKINTLKYYKTQFMEDDPGLNIVRDYAKGIIAGGYGERIWAISE